MTRNKQFVAQLFLNFCNNYLPLPLLFSPTSLLSPICDLFEYQSLLFVYDYLSDNLPISFTGVFPTNNEIQIRTTRQSNLLYIPRYSSKFAQKLPIFSLPSLWNSWVISLPVNVSRPVMKRSIKHIMLGRYPHAVQCDNQRCAECFRN